MKELTEKTIKQQTRSINPFGSGSLTVPWATKYSNAKMNDSFNTSEDVRGIKDLVFRPLRADEIEVRHSDPEYGKVKLLLYKNARVDMNILDETVGPLNWQRDYYKEGELLFCKIGIKHPKTGEWIWKTDTGSPTEYDAEKGWVSDAFKRTAVCFGIGRELYTGPKIVIPVDEEMDNYKGKYCQDFRVNEIDYSNGVITKLVIVDRRGMTPKPPIQ